MSILGISPITASAIQAFVLQMAICWHRWLRENGPRMAELLRRPDQLSVSSAIRLKTHLAVAPLYVLKVAKGMLYEGKT